MSGAAKEGKICKVASGGGTRGGKLFCFSSWPFVVMLHLRRRRNGTFFSEDAAGNLYYTPLPGKGPSFSAENKNILCSMTCAAVMKL